jgi:hypothetical protein
MSLPLVRHQGSIGNCYEISCQPDKGCSIRAEDRRPDRPRVHGRRNQVSCAGYLRPAQHPLYDNVDYIQPIVEKEACTAYAGGKKEKKWLEIRGAHQRLFLPVARAPQVCHFGYRNEEIQDGIHQIMDSTGEIDIHKGERYGVHDRTHRAADVLGQHYKVRNSLAHIGHGRHEIQGSVGSIKAKVAIDFGAVGQNGLDEIEDGKNEMLEKVEHTTAYRMKNRGLLNESWDGVAIQETQEEVNHAVPHRNDASEDYVGQLQDFYNSALNEWTKKCIVTPRKVGPYPWKFLVHEVKNGAQSHQGCAPQETPRKGR